MINEALCHSTCVEWSNDNLRGTDHHADNQNAPCGQLYASICSFDADTINRLVDAPPAAPPTPILPDADLEICDVTRVSAKGGVKGLDPKQAQDACGDNAHTECAAEDTEQPVRYASVTYALLSLAKPTHCRLLCYVRSGSCSTWVLSGRNSTRHGCF